MKIQGLAIIFVIIILPITIIIGEYINTQIQLLKIEQLYDTRLINATDDAIDAFQINTFNDATSDIADSKINSIEASANAFFNSLESSLELNGYTKEDLLNYVPALVYTMYDGYYIYSAYSNVADISSGDGNVNIDLEPENIDYGFKPYIYYSCRYIRGGTIDVVITYALDNYINVQGSIDGEVVNKSGYLLTVASSEWDDDGVYYNETTDVCVYNGIKITSESALEDKLVEQDGSTDLYKYIKINGIKYYLNSIEENIFYLNGQERVIQVAKASDAATYEEYKNQIENNRSAINYYKNAYEFSNWVYENLGSLKAKDARINREEVDELNTGTGAIFVNNPNSPIEYPESKFNLHRKAVIRYSIERNLSVAIANFNNYAKGVGVEVDFQMPKLKENEWDLLVNEVSLISFLQGLNMGGKIYNGYTVVTNSKTEEVVKEESIYMTSNDGYYHKINDEHLLKDEYKDKIVSGVLNLDFEIRKDGATGKSYVQKPELGCYISIVGQENNVSIPGKVQENNQKYNSIYEYLKEVDKIDDKLKKTYYTALARERWGAFKVENNTNVKDIIDDMLDTIIEDAVPTLDYGAYVTNYVASNGSNDELGINGWRIFYSEGNTVYLIADNYVSIDKIPGAGPGREGYDASFSMLNGIEEYIGIEPENIRAKHAQQYLLDKNIWAGFKDTEANGGFADYAVGASTLELFVSSYNKFQTEYNKLHPEDTKDIIQLKRSGNGYKFKWSEGTEYIDKLSGLNKQNPTNLYVISNRRAIGVWLATTKSEGNNQLLRIYGSGKEINSGFCSDTDDGVRPVICLRSDVKLIKQGDGTYIISED